jgi:hypothetical protein
MTLPKRWQAIVSNIPPPGSGDGESVKATLNLEIEFKSQMDETLCKILEGITGAGSLLPKVGPVFDIGGLISGMACAWYQ